MTGLTPEPLCTQYKEKRACTDVAVRASATISEVAYAVGSSNLKYFYEMFKEGEWYDAY